MAYTFGSTKFWSILHFLAWHTSFMEFYTYEKHQPLIFNIIKFYSADITKEKYDSVLIFTIKVWWQVNFLLEGHTKQTFLVH